LVRWFYNYFEKEMKMKALLASLMIVLAVGFAGCAGEEAAPEGDAPATTEAAPADGAEG
jgi:hypothetical protein